MNHYSIGEPREKNALSVYTDVFTSTLKEFNVPEQYYSVGKIKEESICILPHDSQIEVFIWERGRKRSLKVFKEPKSAFMYAISLMTEDSNEEETLSLSFLSNVSKHTSNKQPLDKVAVTLNDSATISMRSGRSANATSSSANATSKRRNELIEKLAERQFSRPLGVRAKKRAKVFEIGEVTVSGLKKKGLQKIKRKLDGIKK